MEEAGSVVEGRETLDRRNSKNGKEFDTVYNVILIIMVSGVFTIPLPHHTHINTHTHKLSTAPQLEIVSHHHYVQYMYCE